MNTNILKLSIIILASIFLLSSPALAGGKGKNKSRPPGWEQGEKTGWKGEDTPPGLDEEKLEKKQKAKMKGDEVKDEAQQKSRKAEQEKAGQEAGLEKEKNKRETEMEKEKEKLESQSMKKKGQGI